MGRILAVAHNTFRRCFSAWTTFIVLALFVAILYFVGFQDVVGNEDDRIALVAGASLGAAWTLTIVAMIMVGATSLSGEVADRSIYFVLSRPVAMWQIITGKLVGLTVVALTLFVPMHLLGYGMLHLLGTRLPSNTVAFDVFRQVFAQEHDTEAANPEGWLAAGEGEVTWVFTRHNPKKLPYDRVTLRLGMPYQASGTRGSRFAKEGSPMVAVAVYKNGRQVRSLSRRLYYPKTEEFVFEPSVLTDDGTLTIGIRCITEGFSIYPGLKNLQSVAGRASYFWNYIKAASLTFYGVVLLISICVLASTFLSTSVAALLTATVFFAGTQIGFLEEYYDALEQTRHHAHDHGSTNEETAAWLKTAKTLLQDTQNMLIALVIKAFPNFDQFDNAIPSVEGRLNIATTYLFRSMQALLLYGVPCFVLSVGALRFREIG